MAPAETEPLPTGNPVPSGATVISSLLISSGLKGRPRFGCCAKQTDEIRQSAAGNRIPNLNVNMFYRPIRFDTPALNAIKVIELDWRILGDPNRSGRLHLTFLIRGSAHQRCGAAIPLPGKPKPSQRLRYD